MGDDWPEDDHASAFSKEPPETPPESDAKERPHRTEHQLDSGYGLPRAVKKQATKDLKMGNKRPLHQRATMMFKKYDENIPDIDIVSHLHSVEKKLLDLVGEFDSDKLKSGAKPEQKLSPIKTGGYFGFQNILVYGVEVAAPIDVCFKTFYTGVFHTDGTAKNGTCPFYSGSTEPLPSDGVH